ncbi:MAG: DNA polymerase III subunit gamma/tau [Desulfobulbaceae bacterium]|uniref:DNA polymerase III subunit gamma/tau n=1 Tax=Candidatus Desulfobia pelagia TaxID=2841692 RepID=A0A8J6NGY8_9BACT|nr:DNA polymerase III subunit gamma/tau [Candidatus Desulfobia pelagia]
MSYLVLARKWRPQTFSDVVGQQPVVQTLKNGLLRNRVAHAMIFSGVRGVGKTTLARIMAKALNCQGEGEDKPCNSCESCLEMTKGAAIDLHEIDGASNRGIQEIRELKENIRFFPVKGRYKIIIIDEVHMLTTEAFNALLKTLEEPPAHVYFMFATTEIHKVPVTILSRCQRYELKRVPYTELKGFFAKIAAEENVKVSEKAIEMIAREADGSVRDGLSLLDQIFSFCGDVVEDADVVQVLGLVDSKIFTHLAEALFGGDLERALSLLEESYNAGLDLKRFSGDLLRYFRALMVCQTCSKPAELIDVSDQELQELAELAQSQSKETVYRYFQILMQGMEEMRYSSHPRLTLEMTFIKAIQAGQVVPVATLLSRLEALIQGGVAAVQADTQVKAFVPVKPAPPVSREQKAVTPKKTEEELEPYVPKPRVMEPLKPVADLPEAPEKEESLKVDEVNEADEVGEAESAGEEVAIATRGKDVRKNWNEFADYVKERKQWMAQVLRLCEHSREEDATLVIRFDNPSDCHLLKKTDNLKDLTMYAQDFFQKELRVKINTRDGEEESSGADEGGSPREERRALASDPLVKMVTEIFDGKVSAIRTGPRFR